MPLQVLEVFPSQRPVPSLGGGIGYGAEGIDCWELDGPARGLGQGCFVPVEDTGKLLEYRMCAFMASLTYYTDSWHGNTGMGFHQKGW